MIKDSCANGTNVKQTAADEIIEIHSNIVDRIETLANKVDSQLLRFCSPETPCEAGKDNIHKNFPPYFEELREKAYRINNAIDRIYDILDRAEL